MLPILQIGPLALQVPGLMILLGIWAGLSLAEKRSAAHDIKAEQLYNLAMIGLLAGLAGARLGYAFSYPDAFLASPLSLFSLNPGMLDSFFGTAAALIAAIIYGQRARLPFWKTLDALTPALAVFMVGLALAHAASGEAFGAETSLPWGIDLWGARRHPSQFYELVSALLILALISRPQKLPAPAGTLFLGFLALTSGAALYLEAFRGDSATLLGGIRSGQVIAWALMCAAFFGLDRLTTPQKHKPVNE